MTGGTGGVTPTTNGATSRLLRSGCHPADRVVDTETGGERKVKGGTGGVSPTTLGLCPAEDVHCCSPDEIFRLVGVG